MQLPGYRVSYRSYAAIERIRKRSERQMRQQLIAVGIGQTDRQTDIYTHARTYS